MDNFDSTTVRRYLPVAIIVVLALLIGWLCVDVYNLYHFNSIRPIGQTDSKTATDTAAIKDLVDDAIYKDISDQLKTGGDVDANNTSVLRSSIAKTSTGQSFVATDYIDNYSYLIQVFTNQTPTYVIVSCAPIDQQVAHKTDCTDHFKESTDEAHE